MIALRIRFPRNKRSTLQRFFSYFPCNFISPILLPFADRYDVVLTMSPSLANAVIAFFARLLRRAPFVYNVVGFFRMFDIWLPANRFLFVWSPPRLIA